jgi:diacylglycerol kinase (ATP)
MLAKSSKKTILFVINPVLEKKSGLNLADLIMKFLDVDKFDYDILYSESPGQISSLPESKKKKYQIFIAAGGDGTVNSVGRLLIHSGNILGIIPLGSGNGLSRSLKIPQNPKNAIKNINRLKISTIDTGLVNDIPFLNMAGTGFDAMVAHRYNQLKKRGFPAYLMSVLATLFRYSPQEYEIRVGQKSENVKAFLLAIGNTSQWGYHVHICPEANPADGTLDMNILKKFPVIVIPFLACRLFLKNLHHSKYSETIRIKEAEISGIGEMAGHIDGEPIFFQKSMHVKVIPGSLKVITGDIQI